MAEARSPPLATSSAVIMPEKPSEEDSEPISTEKGIDNVRQSSLYKLCWPFLILMRLGGLFFIHPGPVNDNQVHNDPFLGENGTARGQEVPKRTGTKKWEIFEWCSTLYCFAVFGIGIAYGVRFMYSMNYSINRLKFTDSDLGAIVGQVSYALWIVQQLLTSVHFLLVCWRPSELSELFLSWDHLRFPCPMQECKRFNFSAAFLWRRNVIGLICILHCIVQWMATDFPVIIPGPAYSQIESNLMQGFRPDDAGIKVLNFLGGLYTSFVFIVPAYFFALIATTLLIDFRHITRDLAIAIKDNGMVTLKSLEWFRLRHNSLCILLETADTIFGRWIALILGCNLYQFLAMIYTLASTARYSLVLTDLNNLYWLLTFFAQLAVVLCRGAAVNEAAHEPALRLYQVDQSRLSIPESLQLQSFLSKLNTHRTGFTAWKLITINYEALLVVLGTYVTYQILLFQLQLDLGLDSKVDKIGETCFPTENAGQNVTGLTEAR